jgi:4-amino-4-deoxy-L-arabinose transferase-like glycosyltransferase
MVHKLQITNYKLRILPVLAGFFLLLTVYLSSAFSPPLLDDADSSHAEVAREMLVRSDYVTLHVNGIRYLEKAPLMYWLVAFSFRVFGAGDFAVRFPTLLAMVLSAWLALRWASRAFGERAGVYGVLFLASTIGVYLFTRILIPEAILSLLIAASLYFFLTAGLQASSGQHQAGNGGALRPGTWRLRLAASWRWYAGYACAALAVLTKGLAALAFVGLTLAVYLLITGEWRRWREFRLGTGIVTFLLIAAPWHVLAAVRNHGFLWFYFVNEHFLRFLGRRIPRDYNKLPAAAYWGLHLVWLFPWSMYLVVAVPGLWRAIVGGPSTPLRAGSGGQGALSTAEGPGSGGQTAKAGGAPGAPLPAATLESRRSFSARTRLLCLIWAAVVLVFFSLSTNQEYYTFPAYFPILLLLAGVIAKAETAQGLPSAGNGQPAAAGRLLAWSAGIVALLSIAAGSALLAGLWAARNLPYVPDISAVLAQHDLSKDTLAMSHMMDLTGQSFAALRLPAALAVVALLLGPVAAFWLRLRRRHGAATWVTACAMVLLFLAAHVALNRFAPYMSSQRLAQAIAGQVRPEDEVMIYGDQSFGSSLIFYLQRPIYVVNDCATTLWFGSRFPDAPQICLNDSDLQREWASPRRVFLFVTPYDRTRVDALLAGPRYVVAESSAKVIYSNQAGDGTK